MPKTKKLALMAVLTAIALTIFMLEAQLPAPVPIPGVKLGLANIVTLTAMLILGRREAGAILAARIVMGAVFAGNPSAMLYSAAGGVLAYAAMCLLVGVVPEKRLWAVSAVSAVAHNMGQLIAARFIISNQYVWYYLPVLLAAGLLMGAITGMALRVVMPYLDRLSLK